MRNEQELKLTDLINKDFYSSSIPIEYVNNTREILRKLLTNLDPKESEEHNKNLIRDFLIQLGYKSNQVNTSGRIDLAISHNGYNNVIIETKDFGNPQMLTTKNINHKAIHELILYFMREYLVHNNQHVTYLIATNGVEWFIFKATDFKKLFIDDKRFVREFEDSDVQKSLTDTSTNNFYKHIAKTKVAKVLNRIHYLHFDWSREFHGAPISDRLASNIYKLFNPVTMFKETFVSDSNALNVNFYNELLYIMGLREKTQSKGIERLPKNLRHQGSLIELIYYAINDNSLLRTRRPQQVFDDVINMAMSFIDRLLFLKLLEGQLIKFNGNNKKFSFLNNKKIQSFSDVDDLFFKVLAVPIKDRVDYLKEKYPYIPYLNSSLFERTPVEREYDMSPIKLHTFDLPLYKHSVLRKRVSKGTKSEKTLTYLINFLNSYSFNANGRSFNNQELINSSVLGSIFEKINGYKDGSFFTPGFVTSYMAHTGVHKALLNKFNRDGFHISKLSDLLRYDPSKVKRELDDFHLVDPAVGSGHFLVSALNYLVKVYNDLNLLTPYLTRYNISIKNDELVINNVALHKSFHYIRGSRISTKIQKSIFDTKRKIIENNLFGVDLNPNSVNITKLRLWIELLKNSYYKSDNLVTMPNLEMNIKPGNSIISRYTLDQVLSDVSNGTHIRVKDFKRLVNNYKNTSDKQKKHKIGRDIKAFKDSIVKNINNYSAKTKLRKAYLRYNQAKESMELISTKSIRKSRRKIISKAKHNLDKAKSRWSLLMNNKVYEGSFEWRFEFPELLDDNGNFMGFDLVIANPPYIKMDNNKSLFDRVRKTDLGRYANKRMDLFYYFFYRSIQLLSKSSGVLIFITTNYWLTDDGAEMLRDTLKSKLNILQLINFNNFKIFSSALGQHNMITEAERTQKRGKLRIVNTKESGKASSNVRIFNNIVRGKDPKTIYNHINNSDLYDTHAKNIINLSVHTDKILDSIVTNVNSHSALSDHIGSCKGITMAPDKAFVLNRKEYANIKPYLNKYENSLIYPLINGSEIKQFNEPNVVTHYVIYSTKHSQINSMPYLSHYIYEHSFKTYKDGTKKKSKRQGSKYYYALHRPRKFLIMHSASTIFVPHWALRPYFIQNINHFLVKDDSYFIYPTDKSINVKALLLLLNSSLVRFLWIYHHIMTGSLILIKKLSFDVIPFTINLYKKTTKIDVTINQLRVSKSKQNIQRNIDQIVNSWFNITSNEYKHILKFIHENQ